MAHFKYEAQNSNGKSTSGVITATTVMEASDKLRSSGNKVININPLNESTKSFNEKLKALNYTSGPSTRDILNFTTQLAVMVRAGISIMASIEAISEQTENTKFKKILLTMKSDIESGKPFSDALAKHPKQFSMLYVNMVRASEMSGSFAHMLDRIAQYLSQQQETKAMVRGAMIYPGVIFAMAVSATVFLLTFVLPKFGAVFKGHEDVLPWPTIFLMGLSSFMVNYWWAVAAVSFLGLIALVLFIKTEAGGLFFDRLSLVLPPFGKMFKALYISRSLHTMGELVNSGVPMLDTLNITGRIAGNRLYKIMWREVHDAVKQGKKIVSPLEQTTLLPKSVVQMLSAGEESGKLGEVLDEVSAYYAKLLRETIKIVTGMIEPVMIVFMGAMVGFIAMAIILPIFKMSSLVK